MGTLINKLYGGEVNTVTSMAKITGTISDSGSPCVGGIIGSIRSSDTINDVKYTAGDVKIAYCSNYGPVTINKSGAGEIVGSIAENRSASTTIDYCFNGSSVLAGYTTTTESANTNYAGGIVGNINENTGDENTVTVSNCYNAGIIKAGHKANTSMSYAAGIVAHAKGTNAEGTETEYAAISNCYNEGSIEALGIDPTTEYVVTGVDYDDAGLVTSATSPKIYLVQTNDKNVSGYHIADIAVTNCAKSDDADLELDGAILEKSESYASGQYSFMEGKIYGSNLYPLLVNGNGEQIYGGPRFMVVLNKYWIGYRQDELAHDSDNSAAIRIFLTTQRSVKTDESGKLLTYDVKNGEESLQGYALDTISSLQFNNKLNISEIFVDTQPVYANISVDYHFESLSSGSGGGPTGTSTTINRNYYYDFKDQIEGKIETAQNALGLSNTDGYSALNKSAFGQSYNADTDKNQTVSINGDNYTLAYNYGNAFENKTYSYTWTTTIDNIGITDDSAIDSSSWGYSVTATGNGKEIESSSAENDPTIKLEVSDSGSGRTFTFSYRGDSLGTNPTLSGTITYSKEVALTLNTATSDFIYIDDGSFAIDLRGNYSIALGAGGTSTNTNYLANFVTSGATLSYNNSPGYQNVLELESGGQTYYFVLDTTNNRLIYYINATVTGVDGVVNSKGDGETLLDVVGRIPKSFDDITLEAIVFTTQVTPNDYSVWTSKTEEDSFTFNGDYDVSDGYSLAELSSLGIVSSYNVTQNPDASGNYSLTINFATTFRRLLVYGEFLNTSMLGVYSSGAANTTSRYIDSQYEVTGTYSIDSNYHSVLTLYSTNNTPLTYIYLGTYIFTVETDTTGSAYVENINSTCFRIKNDKFKFEESLSNGNEDISITYSRSIDYSRAVISGDSIMATNYAYYLGATGTAVATYKISSVTNNGDQNVVYNADGTFGILAAGTTMQGSWDNVEILQTYNGTSDRPIKAGDEVTIEYNRSENTVDGTTTETYKKATFNVVQNDDSYSLVYKEGYSYNESYTDNGEDEGTESKEKLHEDEINAILGALDVHENNSVLYIYSNSSSMVIDSVDRTTNVNDTLEISMIKNTKLTATLELSGIGLVEKNNDLFLLDDTSLSTYFNNITAKFNLQESWNSGNIDDISLTNYTEPSGSVKAIILMNDIFAPAENFAIGFNIYGNGYAIVSGSTGNLFGAIGDASKQITIKDIAFVGATANNKITDSVTNTTLSDIDFYGTVYNGESGNTLGLNGISDTNGSNINIYTAIYGKNGVNSKAAATYRGVVFAADGQDGLTTVNATAGQSIALTNATNNLIAIKAGDGGNGAVTLSSGLPAASDIKVGGAAGTSSVSETFASTSGISGGVYRRDETDNSADDFKARALGAVYTSTDKNGNHILLGFDENGNRTATVTGDLGLDNASIIIRSPDSTLYNLSGAKSNFAVFYEGGGDDSPYAAGLLSSGGRGDFVYAADGEHLGQDAFKYLVLDANDNSVYSKSSFIAAGASTLENLRMNKSDIENLFANEMISTIKITSLYYGSSSSVLRYEINENNQTIGNSLSEWYKSINENKTFMVHTEVSENPNISGEEWITGLQGYKNDTVILSALGWALGMTTMEEVQAWIDNDFVFDIDKVTFIVEITFK